MSAFFPLYNRLKIVHLVGGDAGQSGKLRSAETTLAGDNLVFVVAKLAQGDGLYDADFGDGIS